MSDLISRQAVDDVIYDYSRSCDVNYAQIMEYIDKIPSVENKGEWERVSGGSFIDVYRCSKCKHEPPKKPLPDIKTWGWDFTDFCPNCGAKMKGSE